MGANGANQCGWTVDEVRTRSPFQNDGDRPAPSPRTEPPIVWTLEEPLGGKAKSKWGNRGRDKRWPLCRWDKAQPEFESSESRGGGNGEDMRSGLSCASSVDY
jgi:hypothetical protein